VLCHSIEGIGNKKGPLDDVGARLKGADIRAWLTSPDDMRAKTNASRKPAMRNFSSLSKEQIDALVAYLQAQKAVSANNDR
jgi:mono/diheme cytochrome c family protein